MVIAALNLEVLRKGSFLDTPVTYQWMDDVTEWMNPKQPPRAYADGATGLPGEPVILDKELDCIESLEKRVVGALCFAGLLVAAEVEVVVRLVLALVVAAVSFLFSTCVGDMAAIGDQALEHAILSGILIVDAPVRIISALVQKCLLDAQGAHGRKNLRELSLC
ncbi:MAG: hypothetical protein HYX48_02480 [Chlamydiales bacterium]|nr:hypothetical protein [Chlamydiales bacterium]